MCSVIFSRNFETLNLNMAGRRHAASLLFCGVGNNGILISPAQAPPKNAVVSLHVLCVFCLVISGLRVSMFAFWCRYGAIKVGAIGISRRVGLLFLVT